MTLLTLNLIGISAEANPADPANPANPLISSPYPPTTITIDPIISSDSASCVIPFTRAGNLILIQAKADTSTGFFVLDTGTPDLVLNLTYFRHYPTSNPTESGGVTGSVVMALQTTVDSLRLGPISYRRLEAGLINLAHIENNKRVKILGLLGLRLFEHFEMIIDYNSNRLYLHLINRKETPAYRNPQLLDTSSYYIIPIDIESDKMIVYLFLKGRKLKFIIDTGAETNILDSRLPGKVFEQVEITRRVTLDGSGSHKVEALVGALKGLHLGDRDIGNLPVLITNLQSMCDAYNNCLDGMLGFDFLSLHKIGFNFVTRKMYIWK
ncbi:MAG TPA: pepsin/retropepsin-like aspartic protease family protein [Puia sp.]|nr:pepsin/retropepsin-like aspartic protease family protein [Puia sp.]